MGRRRFGLKALVTVAVASIILGVLITARLDFTSMLPAQSFWKEPEKGVPHASPLNFVELTKKVSPAVVNISTTQKTRQRPFAPFPDFRGPFEDFFDDFDRFFEEPRDFKRQTLGSGFVINKDGFILTNNHVIENATEIIVTFSEGRKNYRAKVIGQDKKLDLALIKIDDADDLPLLPLGDSDSIDVGEWVIAIGNPFGLGGTVTAGIVSQKGRIIGAGPYDNFIQTDASINPGNSGGPLINMRGEVVGINTAIVAGGQGIGFATPINMAKEVLPQLREFGRVTRGWIGVTVQEVTPELAKSFGLKEPKGALVSSVIPGDPAEAGGLEPGDIITSFDGKTIESVNDLPRVVAGTTPGKEVEVSVIRDGKEKTLAIRVGKRLDDEEEVPVGKDLPPDEAFGIVAKPLTPEIARGLGVPEKEGVYIHYVRPESPAGRADLRRGDVVKEIDRRRIRDIDDYRKAIEEARKKDVARFLVRRGRDMIFIPVVLKED